MAVVMKSDGKGTFSIESTEYNSQGTEITLSIKKDESEFLSKYKIYINKLCEYSLKRPNKTK